MAYAGLDADSLSRLYGHPLREIRDKNSRWLVPEMSGVTFKTTTGKGMQSGLDLNNNAVLWDVLDNRG